MATQTHQRRSVVTQSRPHDHLYDPIYTASGTHNPYPQYSTRPIPSWNATSELASTQTAPTMRFSAIHSAADASAQRTAHRQQLQQTRALYKQEQAHQQEILQQQVLGRDRTKFIKRPVVPYLEPVVAGLLQNPTSLEEQVINHQEQEEEMTMTRTIGIQTDYRESETQTDPYTADYITSPDDPEPELLALAHLTYGAGLPASLDEIQLIQRMREKRAFEASLPPISDAASFELRKKLLEERELAEWSIREAEMKKEQEDRLAILVQTLAERERVSEELAEARIDKIRQAKLAERDETFDAIHRDRIKQDRQLLHEKDEREEKIKSTMIEHQLHKPTHRRDIIAEYGDHASQVYAPIAREGKLPVKNQVVDYGIPLLSNFQGLSELERSLPAHLRDITISAPTKIIPASLSTRKGQQIANDLAYVDRLLDRKKEDLKPPVIENVYKKFEPLQRAATPSVTAPAHDAESVATLLLQRLIRGRAIQNIMYEGKQHHIHLIRELRLAEHPPEAQREVDAQHDVNVALDTLQGELISNALDFVSKEIVRVNEEQKIAALVKEATFVRRHREAEESGRRQAEDVMRMKQQQQFEMTMADHQATADRYLADILSSAVSSYAHRHASQDASLRANHVAPILATIENEQENAERIVNDLVASFVLPEVERRREKRAEDLSSRRFIDQAHHSVLYAVQQTLLRYQQKLLEKNGTTSTSAPTTTKT